MTYSPPSPSQLYGTLATSWSRAGANPFDFIETALEMLAAAKLNRAQPKSASDFEAGELTTRSWRDLRHGLERALGLSEASEDSLRLFDRVPGLLEETRRSLMQVFPILSKPKGAAFASGLLVFLAHAPQTGIRHTAIGYVKWPEYLPELLRKLIGKPDLGPLYCPFDSSRWMPLFMAEGGWDVSCEVANSQAARVLILFAYVGGWSLKARVGDPIRQPGWIDGQMLRQFARSVAITNFGLRMREEPPTDRYGRFPVRFHYGEAMQVAHLIAQTKGLVAVIVPEALLFRTSGSERDYKELLIRRGMLSAVIRLPRDTFAPYANVQSSLLLFDTASARGRDVLFVDASDDLGKKGRSRAPGGGAHHEAVEQIRNIVQKRRKTALSSLATYDDIAAHEFNISVDRYVRSERELQIDMVLEETKTLDLIDIAEVIRPQAVAGEGSESAHAFAEVGLQDLEPDGFIRAPGKLVNVDDQNLAKAMRQRVEPGDVLMSVRGRIGATGIVPERQDDGGPADWLASQAFVILRLRHNSPISSLILYRYLSSPMGQGLLQSLATGMTVPMISMGDVKKLRVMIPSADEQRAIVRQYEKVRKLRAQIRDLEKLANDLNAAAWPMTKVSIQTTDEKVD